MIKLFNHIYSLPYPDLLSFLQHDPFKSISNLNSKDEFFKLAMFHESQELKQVSSHLGAQNSKQYHLQLDKAGYEQIFNGNDNEIYKQKLTQYQQYLKDILLSQKTTAVRLDFFANLTLNPSSILLNCYSLEIDNQLRRKMKQTYIELVYLWSINSSQDLRSSRSQCQPSNYHIWRLFPPQMFSLTDQSLIKAALANGKIINQLPVGKTKFSAEENLVAQSLQNLADIERSMVWLSRFSLYNQIQVSKKIIAAILNIQREIQNLRSVRDTVGFEKIGQALLIAANCLYVISRKIVNEQSSNKQLCMENHLIKSVLDLIFQLFPKNYHTQEIFIKIINEIESSFIEEQDKLQSKLQALSNKYMKGSRLPQKGKSKIFYKQILTKFIRFHLLSVLLSENSDSLLKDCQAFFQLTAVEDFYRDNITLGDLCAQTIYTGMVSAYKMEDQMIINRKSKLWRYLSDAQQKYNTIIPKMIKQQKLDKKYKLKRINIFQNIMLNAHAHNRHYSNSVASMQDKQNQIGLKNKQNMIYSLLNDQQFVGHYLIAGQIKKSFGQILQNKDLRVLVKKNGQYPLFCDYLLENNVPSALSINRQQQKQIAIWIRNQFCQKHRIANPKYWKTFYKQQQSGNKNMINSENIILEPSELGNCFKEINRVFSKLIN